MIYDNSGNVVVQNRRDPDWGGIAFPGGHVENGESFTDAVIREVNEETGLTISDIRICGIKNWIRDDGIRYIVHLYKTNKFEGELRSSEEGEVMWVSLETLPEMELAEGMETMIRLFCDDSLTEQYFYKENGKWVEFLK